jgi:protein SCO1/2
MLLKNRPIDPLTSMIENDFGVFKRRSAIKKLANFALLTCGSASFLTITSCSNSKPQFKAIDITGASYAGELAAADALGQKRSLADFKGKTVVVFFGYTQCPDVCPTTMAELAEVKKQLGAEGDKLQGVFVSLDPERDTPEVLKAYMTNFDPSFVALRPDLAALPEVAKAFKIYYKKVDGKTPTSYTLDHSAGSFIYDAQGRVRLFTRYGSGIPALLSDVQWLVKNVV